MKCPFQFGGELRTEELAGRTDEVFVVIPTIRPKALALFREPSRFGKSGDIGGSSKSLTDPALLPA